MFKIPAFSARRFYLFLSVLLWAIAAFGCSDVSGVGRTVPVTGKVILQDAPLTAKTTIVLFKPDSSRGNTSPFEPAGTVDAEGNYTLATKGKSGAPPGWYKVIVTAREETALESAKNPKQHRPATRSLVPAKYGQEATSGLSIEVVENPLPGAYDLKLSR